MVDVNESVKENKTEDIKYALTNRTCIYQQPQQKVDNWVKSYLVSTLMLPVIWGYIHLLVFNARSGFTNYIFNHLPRVSEGKYIDDWKGVNTCR